MNDELRKDLEYRIENVRTAIKHIITMEDTTDVWDDGYHCGSLSRLESELRFLEQMVARYTKDG